MINWTGFLIIAAIMIAPHASRQTAMAVVVASLIVAFIGMFLEYLNRRK